MIDSPLTVTCRSIPAKMYKEIFESGSKGKCTLYQLERLTPNQFEEIAGSKSKKYLSSIKCLGRPLCEFVKSRELIPVSLNFFECVLCQFATATEKKMKA